MCFAFICFNSFTFEIFHIGPKLHDLLHIVCVCVCRFRFTLQGETSQQAGPLLSLDVLHLAGVQALVLMGGTGQLQFQCGIGALRSGTDAAGQRLPLQRQRAAGLHGRRLLGLGHVGHAVPSQEAVEVAVGLAAQNYVVLFQGFAGWRHTHLQASCRIAAERQIQGRS